MVGITGRGRIAPWRVILVMVTAALLPMIDNASQG
jgi:hypothetical protein